MSHLTQDLTSPSVNKLETDMPIWDFPAAIRRFRYVVLTGLLVTMAMVWATYVHPNGSYYSKVTVALLPPQTVLRPNSYTSTSGSLIMTAGLMARMNDTKLLDLEPVSPDVTLVDLGLKHGTSVKLPDYGGQWANNFSRPILIVEAVGSSKGEVNDRIDSAVSNIRQTLVTMETEANVQPVDKIRLELTPPTPEVRYLSGNRKFAALASVGLGLIGTIGSVVLLDRWRRRRGPQDFKSSEVPRADADVVGSAVKASLSTASGGMGR